MPRVRSANEVARRCVVLVGVVAWGHGEPGAKIVRWLRAQGLWESATPAERRFLGSSKPRKQVRVDATWRVEALMPLLWALRVHSTLPDGKKQSIPEETETLLYADTHAFLKKAKLRSASVLRRAQDFVYRTHWTLRDAEIRRKKFLDGPSIDIVMEQHHALNWLVREDDRDWDDVSTDT